MSDADGIAGARYALGRQLAAYRRAAGLSQHAFARYFHYGRGTVANVETGRQNVPRRFWVQCDEILATGGVLVAGYQRLQRLSRQYEEAGARNMSWAPPVLVQHHEEGVERSNEAEEDDAAWHVISLLSGLTADQVPLRQSTTVTMAVGDATSLTETVELLLKFFLKLDDEHGGGALYRPLSCFVGRLIHQAELDHSIDLRAFGQLSQMTGWLALDGNRHGAARRYLTTAVYAAHEADDPSLAASAMAYMSLQDTYRGQQKSALSLARTAYETGSGYITPLTQTMLATRLARAHAALDSKSASFRSLDRARVEFSRMSETPEPPWISYVDEIELAAQEGACYLDLHMPRRARVALEHAIQLLATTAPHRTRDHVHYLVRLANCDLLDYDVESACHTATQAYTLAASIDSARVTRRLGEFYDALEPFSGNLAARDFRQMFTATAGRIDY